MARRAGTRTVFRPAALAAPSPSNNWSTTGAVELLSSTVTPRSARVTATCCSRCLIGVAEPLRRVGAEVRRGRQRRVRRIEIDEIARGGMVHDRLERSQGQPHASGGQRRRDLPEQLGIGDARFQVTTRRHVEAARLIDAEQPVVPGAIQVDQHRGEVRTVPVERPARLPPGLAARVEVLIADAPVVIGAAGRVAAGQPLELGNHGVHRIAHPQVAADQIGVLVGEHRGAPGEIAAADEIEEDGAAAEERLVIRGEAWRVEATQLRQQLPLAARPLQEGTHDAW